MNVASNVTTTISAVGSTINLGTKKPVHVDIFDPDFYAKCFHMSDLVTNNKYIGPVARMPYLLTDQWRDDEYRSVGLFMSVYVCCTCFATMVLCMAQKYQQRKPSWRDYLVFWFNFTNAFIFTVLVNAGWMANVFIVAALHNSIELLLILSLCKGAIKSILRNNENHMKLLGDISLVVAIATVIPHMLITDFQLNAFIKSAGGITDFLLFLTSVFWTVKDSVNLFRAHVLKQKDVHVEFSHFVLSLNCLIHTLTVIMTFFTCFWVEGQFAFMITGTVLMNAAGVAYFVVKKPEQQASKSMPKQEVSSSELIPASSG